MAVTKPVLFTPVLDAEVAVNRPAQQDLIRKLIQNTNMLAELAVIGAVEAFNINQPGVISPETTVFQLSDGGEITEPTSPLRTITPTSRFTPNTVDRYIRGANASTNSGNELGGAATVNLSHQHTPTSDVTYPLIGNAGTDGYGGPATHHHNVFSDLSAVEPLELAHIKVAFYLKIN